MRRVFRRVAAPFPIIRKKTERVPLLIDRHMCVSIFNTHEQVTDAVALLQASGFDSGLFSLMGRDDWRTPQEIGPFRSDAAVIYGGMRRSFWEKVWSGMPGKGGLWIFESGPLLLAGRIVRALTAETAEPESEVEPATLKRVLTRLGVPLSNLSRYETELKHHRFLLFVEGSLDTVDRAQRAMEATKPTNNTLHHGVSD